MTPTADLNGEPHPTALSMRDRLDSLEGRSIWQTLGIEATQWSRLPQYMQDAIRGLERQAIEACKQAYQIAARHSRSPMGQDLDHGRGEQVEYLRNRPIHLFDQVGERAGVLTWDPDDCTLEVMSIRSPSHRLLVAPNVSNVITVFM